jgi:uncharacterized phage infection (PIP) family protein YhgE
MLQLNVGLPHAVVVSPCGGCGSCGGKCGCTYARYKGWAISLEVCNTPVSTTNYNPYQSNMTICNQNFAKINGITTDLTSQITQLNQQIAELRAIVNTTNTSISSLNTSVAGLDVRVNTHNTTISQVQSQIQTNQHDLMVQIDQMNTTLQLTSENLNTTRQQVTTLTRKIGVILNFLPSFVRETTHWFVRLMTGLRTNNVESIPEFICDASQLTIADV